MQGHEHTAPPVLSIAALGMVDLASSVRCGQSAR